MKIIWQEVVNIYIFPPICLKWHGTQWISLLYRRVQKMEQTTVIDIKTTALKNAIEWYWSHTSDLVGKLVKFY